VYRAEVLHRKLLAKLIDDALQELWRGCSKDDVVDVQQQVRDVGAAVEDKQRAIGLGGDEAEVLQVCGETLEPGSWRLLESVKGLAEQADGVGVLWVDEAGGLLAVHLLCQIAMEKGVLDVKLMYGPVVRRGKMQHGPNCCGLDDR